MLITAVMSRCCYFIVCRVCITPIFKSTFYFCHNLPFLNMKKNSLSSLLIMLKKSSPTFLELFFQFFRSSLVGRGVPAMSFQVLNMTALFIWYLEYNILILDHVTGITTISSSENFFFSLGRHVN